MTKLEVLKEILSSYKGALVAFSGGVDSTFLLKVARDVLGEKVVAVTVDSVFYPVYEFLTAKNMALLIGAKHMMIKANPLDFPEIRGNSPDRCYHCKKMIFSRLQSLAVELGLEVVIDGSNVDDLGDDRPGMKACQELGIRSPLMEAGFTKAEIRSLSQFLNLPTWNLPAYACLATRFPYHSELNEEGLKRVEKGEVILHELGFNHSRLRDHGKIARLEVDSQQFPMILGMREVLVQRLTELGYRFICLDIEGYRSGKMGDTK